MVILTLLGCLGTGGEATDAATDGVENCALVGDEDDDGAADCDDTECLCPESCENARDDDGDGAVDCQDVDCVGVCPESCGDGFDNDADGLTDCDDTDCDGFCPESCDNGRDDDGDGAYDCADSDCLGGCPEWCGSGLDADGDGLLDCADPDCESVCRENCLGGTDDDADGLIDCDDPECGLACDSDQDGYDGTAWGGLDCDDLDPTISPVALEVCNSGLDDDCDGLADDADPGVLEGTKTAYHIDSDADGWGRDGVKGYACAAPGHQAIQGGDCADHRADTHPGAIEVCDGLWDEDCDGLIDEADPDAVVPRWWLDGDGDGWGNAHAWRDDCDMPENHVANSDDCDDADAAIGPAWADWYEDTDLDGFGAGPSVGTGCTPPTPGSVQNLSDCAETDPAIFPGQMEVCDGVDQDCDDLSDQADDSATCALDPNDAADVLLCDVVAPPAATGAPEFGEAVAVHGERLVVGQPAVGDSGSVWSYTLSAGGWTRGDRWVGDDQTDDLFGAAIDIDGDRAMVGSPGVGGVWWLDLSTGTQTVGELRWPSMGREVALAGDYGWATVPDLDQVDFWTFAAGTWAWSGWVSAVGVVDVAVADGLAAVADTEGVAVYDAASGALIAQLPASGVRSVSISGEQIVATLDDSLAVWDLFDGAWAARPAVLPFSATAPFTAVALESGRFVVGAPGEPGHVLVFAEGPTGFVEAFALLGDLPLDAPLDLVPTDAAALDNCVPFGAGGLYGPHAGFAWRDVPAFSLRAGDQIAFDLSATNDVPIQADLALAHASLDGGDEPDANGFVTLATGTPVDNNGNASIGDFELAWTTIADWDFPGGGLIVRVTPTGPFASDDTCTGVMTGADALNPDEPGVSRFWSDADGNWPWENTDTLRVATLRITFVGRAPAFGQAVDVDDDVVVVGVPAASQPNPEHGTAVICLPIGEPAAW